METEGVSLFPCSEQEPAHLLSPYRVPELEGHHVGLEEPVRKNFIRKGDREEPPLAKPDVSPQDGVWRDVRTYLFGDHYDIATSLHGHAVQEVPLLGSLDPVTDPFTSKITALWYDV